MAIQTRGNFFEDPCFEDVQEKFERAIGTILEKAGETPSLKEYMTSYRKLREQDSKKENQAGAISYGESVNTIVLDVHGSSRDDIKVKDVGNNTFQITGKGFDRQFTFPGSVDMELYKLNMSSDGILTITVPRTDIKEVDIPTYDMSSELSSKSDSSAISQASKSRSTLDAQSSSSLSSSSMSNYSKDAASLVDHYTTDSSSEHYSIIAITKKGFFFEDTFFVDIRDNFQASVKEVLEKYGEKSSDDVMTSYRNLRQRELKEENQVSTVLHGDKEHKILLYVNDFKEGDIKVKIVDANRIYIDGSVEKKSGTETFHRQFTLPGLPGTIGMKQATASMSSDGILLVNIPRVEERRSSLTLQERRPSLTSQSLDIDSGDSMAMGKSMKAMRVEDSMSSFESSSSCVSSVKVASYSKTTVISSSSVSSSSSFN